MGRLHLISLRWRLLFLVALAIAPLVVMTIIVGVREREHALTGARQNLQRLVTLAAANEAQSIEGAMQILRDVSSVQATLGPAQQCNDLMKAILLKNPDYVNFGLIQLDGTVTCSAVKSSVPVNLADRAHFKRAISERRFIAGNYVFGRVVQKHTVNMTYPIIERGKVIAVLFAAIDLTELDKFIDDIKLPAGSVLWTLDSENSVISHRPDPLRWFGKKMPGASELIAHTQGEQSMLRDTDGVVRLYASARVGPPELSDYKVLIGVPEDQILFDARRDQRDTLIGLLVTVLLAGIAAWWGGELLIVRRVRLLASTANLIASGSLSTRTGLRYGSEEISELARALDEMAKSLERKDRQRDEAEAQLVAADKSKDEFLAMLAHELRNPLAPISAGAQLLQQTQKNNPTVARTANIIVRQVDHMTRLVDDLIDVSRVTRGLIKLDIKPVDLRIVVKEACEQIAPLIAKKEQVLTVAIPPEAFIVEGDKERLVQIAGNLINNAAKYTPNGGNVSVSLVREDANVKMTVDDNGIGMDPDLVPKVFDLFAQAERTADRSQGGLGLGLALVKNLVALHGGTVHAESAGTGLGSRFTVMLRRSNSFVDTMVSDAAGIDGSSAQCCLVVDDNVDAAQAIGMLLEAAGHTVVLAHTGMEGLALAAVHTPSVCLLDIGLPDIDGNELPALIRELPNMKMALIVAVTGYGQKEDRQRSSAAGFDQHLVKPVEMSALHAIIEKRYGAARNQSVDSNGA